MNHIAQAAEAVQRAYEAVIVAQDAAMEAVRHMDDERDVAHHYASDVVAAQFAVIGTQTPLALVGEQLAVIAALLRRVAKERA